MAISIHTTWIHSAGWDKREAYSLIKDCGFDGVDFDLSQSLQALTFTFISNFLSELKTL